MAAPARLSTWLSLILRLAIAAVFLWAGAAKALDPAAFAQGIDNYRIFPYWFAAALALYLPWLEMLAAAGLAMGIAPGAALTTLIVLLGAFEGAMASAWLRGMDINCGCFGGQDARAGLGWPMLRGMILLVSMLVLALLWRSGRSAAVPAAPPD